MGTYVDDMEAKFVPEHVSGRSYTMCHMIADTEAELHAMADTIGVQRKWYQGDHYDIAKSKRALAVKAGAIEITWREAGRVMGLRRRGLPATVNFTPKPPEPVPEPDPQPNLL